MTEASEKSSPLRLILLKASQIWRQKVYPLQLASDALSKSHTPFGIPRKRGHETMKHERPPLLTLGCVLIPGRGIWEQNSRIQTISKPSSCLLGMRVTVFKHLPHSWGLAHWAPPSKAVQWPHPASSPSQSGHRSQASGDPQPTLPPPVPRFTCLHS